MNAAHDLTLSRDEIKSLTGKSWRRKQCSALRAIGVPYRTDDEGWPVVSRQAAIKALGAANDDSHQQEATVNLGFLGRV